MEHRVVRGGSLQRVRTSKINCNTFLEVQQTCFNVIIMFVGNGFRRHKNISEKQFDY